MGHHQRIDRPQWLDSCHYNAVYRAGQSQPSSATAWLLLIFLLPYLGLLLFLLLGSPKLPQKRRAEQRTMSELISKVVAEARTQPELAAILDPDIPPRYQPFVKLNIHLASLPVIDGHIGYTGSQNLFKRNYFRKDAIYYDELVARIRGPVVAAFATDWYCESGVLMTRQTAPEVAIELKAASSVLCQVLPSGSGFEHENNLKLFTALIHAAQHTLVITNPYFGPDDALMTALTSAAERGVEVTLVNSEASDQFLVSHAERSYYEDLLKTGVKIYRYKEPILLHSKHITIDNDIAVIGSSKMDIRSFLLNLEVTLICYAPSVVADLRHVEARNLSKCNAVTLKEWEARSTSEKFFENISRLTAALQ